MKGFTLDTHPSSVPEETEQSRNIETFGGEDYISCTGKITDK